MPIGRLLLSWIGYPKGATDGVNLVRAIIVLAVTMTLFIAYFALRGHASDPVANYRKFVAAHPVVKVSYRTTMGGKPVASGVLLWQRPNRDLLVAQVHGSRYSASNTEGGYVELNSGDETYDESPGKEFLLVKGSRISEAPQTAPALLFRTDLKPLVPPHATISPKGAGDEIHGKVSGMMGESEVWIDVSSNGEITHYRFKSDMEGRHSDMECFLSYEFPKNVTAKDFLTPIPLGYTAYALPEPERPLQKGGAVPLNGWKMAGKQGTENLSALAHQKTFLLAILDEEPPSRRAARSLETLKSRLPVLEVKPGGLSDPSGKLLHQLNPPGYPMFYLVANSGKVVKLWYGFDDASASTFEQQVTSSASEAAASK